MDEKDEHKSEIGGVPDDALKTLHDLMNQGVFAQRDMQIITQAICILCEKNGGKIEIPLKDVQDFQTKVMDLEWEVDNTKMMLTFTVTPVSSSSLAEKGL